jgi:hypothetical protein
MLRSLDLVQRDASALPALCVLQAMLRATPIVALGAADDEVDGAAVGGAAASGESSMMELAARHGAGTPGAESGAARSGAAASAATPSRRSTIAHLQNAHALLDLLLSEMLRFKGRARAAWSEVRGRPGAAGAPAPDAGSLVVPGSRQPYLAEQTTRINVLKFVLSQSDLMLSSVQLEGVWDACVSGALCAAEADWVAWWLNHACGVLANPLQLGGSGFLHFSGAAALSLFDLRMCGDAARGHNRRLTTAGFQCLRTFFRYANTVKAKIVMNPPEAGANLAEFFARDWTVVALDLAGLSTVWSVALTCENAAVAAEAVSLLTSIQTKLSVPLQDRIGEYRQQYIASCCAQLRGAIDERAAGGTAAEFDVKAGRCIALLESVIARSTRASWEREEATPERRAARLWLEPHGVRTAGDPITITIRNRAKGSPTHNHHVRLTLNSNERLETLWMAVLEHVGLPRNKITVHIALNHSDGVSQTGFAPDVSLWDFTLRECRVRDGSSAVVYTRVAPAPLRRDDARARPPLSAIVADPHAGPRAVGRGAPPALVAAHPAFVIAKDDERMRLLFEALALACGETASRIWAMLTHLPTSPSIR